MQQQQNKVFLTLKYPHGSEYSSSFNGSVHKEGSPYAATPPPRPSPLSRDVRPRIDYPPYARNH
ncbi:hypothetical protein KFK09_013575 [Dendrobium nobile]|uniref:Uncharacterized protein n=1 Tax=Dendrobium nobile TaxID=94219 RepID=A0A8T3B7L4_DENNO|nr:hypothetical protein KFK09_013575 [Dendrobium nobile]